MFKFNPVQVYQKPNHFLHEKDVYRVSAAFVGRFRFSHLRLRNQTEEREVKVFRCGVALSSAYYLIFLKISFLVSYLHQFLPAIIVASFIAL